MKHHKFGTKSYARLHTVHALLQTLAARALRVCEIDFGIPAHGGRRTADEQSALFDKGVSKADGWENLSNHQMGNGLDVYAFVDGKASWHWEYLQKIVNAFKQVYNELEDIHKDKWKLEFGIEWAPLDENGIGWDAGHIQLVLRETADNDNFAKV